MLQLLAPICSGQNAQWLSNQGTHGLTHALQGPGRCRAKDFSTNKSRMWAAGAGPDSALCHDSKRTFKTLLWYSVILKQFLLLAMSRTQLCGPRYPAMTYCGPGPDIDITLCVNNQYGHALTQTLRLSDVLFSGNFERRIKIDLRRTWPRLSADWRHWVFVWGPWCHLPSFIETHKKCWGIFHLSNSHENMRI